MEVIKEIRGVYKLLLRELFGFWSDVVNQVTAELGDVAATPLKLRVCSGEILRAEGSGDIHQLREHGDADPCSDGQRTRVKLAIDDRVLEFQHSILSSYAKPHYATASRPYPFA